MKNRFLRITNVNSTEAAIRNSIQAALQHNRTYRDNVGTSARARFHTEFRRQIQRRAGEYGSLVIENEHLANIEQISVELTNEFSEILFNHRLRIGTSQKAFNLYLKFLWCLNSDWPAPPHCPVDSIVLSNVGVSGAWTKLDSIETYMEWISKIRSVASIANYSSIAEWELRLWNAK